MLVVGRMGWMDREGTHWWVSIAALGLPVLPLVNWRFATSYGLIIPSKMSRMCSGIDCASLTNSL